jgi:hypothetical protein
MFCEFWFGTVGMVTGLSSFSPLDVRKRPPTPEFPVSPSDFDEQEIEAKKNTMTIPLLLF